MAANIESLSDDALGKDAATHTLCYHFMAEEARAKEQEDDERRRQEEEERKVMIKIAEMQKKAAKEEADRLESMPDWKARVLGISREDIV